MKAWFRFLSVLFCGLITALPVHADNCANEMYRRYNPDKCSTSQKQNSGMSFATTMAITSGATALIGGTIALLGMSSGGDSGPSTTTPQAHPTLPTYTMVGGDVDTVHLASIVQDTDYVRNADQYNDIRLAYSLARGYTGKTSNIAVFDSDETTFHGANVAHLASGHIAPDANVDIYTVADNFGNFKSFHEIGNIISSASDANIYNFSWSANNLYAPHVRSRQQLNEITDTRFIESLTNAAAQNDAIFVWAAGNDYNSQSSALSAIPLVVPEIDGHFVNVVAWDSETGTLADFSNACGITKNFCITAPGTNLASDITDIPLNGTSFAAPVVSAAIAVIREAFPYMKSTQITALLFETARDLGDVGTDDIYGHGMLDMERATRPVGTALVPLSDNVTVALRTARVSATIGNQIKSKNIKFAFIDSYGRAFDSNLNDNLSVRNRGIGFERLRQHNTPSVTFGNLEFGFKQTNLFAADGFLSTQSDNLISFIGFNNDIQIGNTKLYQHATLGTTRPHASEQSMISGFSDVYTASFEIGATYGDWTISFGTPDTIIGGNMYLNTLNGRAADGTYLYTNHLIDLSTRPSMEYTLRYKFITTGFVDNPIGTDEFYMLAKTKIQF